MRGKVAGSIVRAILALLGGLFQGCVSAGDQTDEAIRWDGEGGWALAGIEHTQASAGAGPQVKQASAALEACGNGLHGGSDCRELLAHGLPGAEVGLVHDEQHIGSRHSVEMFTRGIACLSRQQVQGRSG